MAESLRAIGVGIQSVKGTAAVNGTMLAEVTSFAENPQVTKQRRAYKRNRRITDKRQRTKTVYHEVEINMDVDHEQIGILLASALSLGVTVGDDTTFKVGGSLNPYLTVRWIYGLGEYETLIDARVNRFRWQLNAESGEMTAQFTLRGIKQATTSGNLPAGWGGATPTFIEPTGNPPFEPWQTVFTKGSTNLCIISASFELNNNYNPHYCTPTVAPTSTTPAGTKPQRFTEGAPELQYEIMYEYVGINDASGVKSSYYNAEHDINEPWVIEATDPAGQAADALDYLPTFHVEIPQFQGDRFSKTFDQEEVRQTISGYGLLDATLDTLMMIVLTGDPGSMYSAS